MTNFEIDNLIEENRRLTKDAERYREVLQYLRAELLHSEPNSYYGALWRAIDKALYPEKGIK